jgi:hypothetical protein
MAGTTSVECNKCEGFGTVAEPVEDREMTIKDDAKFEAGTKPKLRKLL